MIFCIYIYHIIFYIYQQGFPYRGKRDHHPTSQTFAHSLCSWNNFFPTKGDFAPPLNKNIDVLN